MNNELRRKMRNLAGISERRFDGDEDDDSDAMDVSDPDSPDYDPDDPNYDPTLDSSSDQYDDARHLASLRKARNARKEE